MAYNPNRSSSRYSLVFAALGIPTGAVCIGWGIVITLHGMRQTVVPATVVNVGAGSETDQTLTVSYKDASGEVHKKDITVFPVVKFTPSQSINVRHNASDPEDVGTEINIGLVIGGSTLLIVGFLLLVGGAFAFYKSRKFSRRAAAAATTPLLAVPGNHSFSTVLQPH